MRFLAWKYYLPSYGNKFQQTTFDFFFDFVFPGNGICYFMQFARNIRSYFLAKIIINLSSAEVINLSYAEFAQIVRGWVGGRGAWGDNSYCIYSNYWDIKFWVNSVDPDQLLLLRRLIRVCTVCHFQQILDTSVGSQMNLFKVLGLLAVDGRWQGLVWW